MLNTLFYCRHQIRVLNSSLNNKKLFKKTEIAKGVLVFRLFIQYYHPRLYYGMECVTFNLNSSVYPVTTVLN